MNKLPLHPQLYSLTNVTWLIPQPGLPIDENSLIQNVDEFKFMDLLIDLTESSLLKNDSLLENLNDLSTVTDPLLKGMVLAGIGNIQSYFGNYAKSFTAFHRALKSIQGTSDPEALAFVYTSISNLLRKLGHKDATLVLAEQALELTKNEFLQWKVRVQRSLAAKYSDDWHKTIDELQTAMRYYAQLPNAFRVARLQRHLAHIYAYQGDYDRADRLLSQAEAIAREEHRQDFVHEIRSDQGYVQYLQNDTKAARALFLDLTQETMIPYQKALVYQNLGLVALKERSYDEAIACFRKSLSITEPNDMRELLLEDYVRLARCYQKVGDDHACWEHYERAYQTVLGDLEMGLPLSSFRKLALDETLSFLKTNSCLDTDAPKVFDRLSGKTLAEARQEFQRTLLALHLQHTPKFSDLSQRLQVTTRSLHGFRVRLGLLESQEWTHAVETTELRRYAEGLLHFSWKTATTHFEDDFIQYTLRKHGFNKRKSARQLGISYPQIMMKTGRKNQAGGNL